MQKATLDKRLEKKSLKKWYTDFNGRDKLKIVPFNNRQCQFI